MTKGTREVRSMVDGCFVATRSHQLTWSLIHIIQIVDHTVMGIYNWIDDVDILMAVKIA